MLVAVLGVSYGAWGLAVLLVVVNVADTIYSFESIFRLQYMFFENLDLTALVIRWEYFLLSFVSAAALLFFFYLLFFRFCDPVPAVDT